MSQDSATQLRQLKAFSLASLHATAYMLTGTVVLWASAARSDDAIAQKSGTTRELPVFIPTTPIIPDQTSDLNSPQFPAIAPPDPTDATSPNQFKRYRLGVGDAVSVVVPRFPDLTVQAAIDIEGNIVLPLVGRVSLVGLTLEEAQQRIRVGLNRYVINPEVTVVLLSQRATQVTIIGEVTKPGFYPLPPNSQLTAALFTAGGSTSNADLRSVLVRRNLANGSTIEQKVDLFTPLQNGQGLPDLRLQDGDAIVVPALEVGTSQEYNRALVSRSSVAQQQITIRVLSYASGGIGSLNLPNGSSFVDALTAIAPNTDAANLRKVGLIRFDPERGKAVTQQLDGKSALMGDVSQNVPLQNNDVIVVGRSLVGKITYALNTFTQPFRDVLGFLLFFDSLRNSATDLFGPTSGNNFNQR